MPLVGVISLVSKSGLLIKARALDISENGIGINEIATCPENVEYQIQITTISHGKIHFSGILVHTYKNTAGFMITNIDSSNYEILKNIINDFQATEEFIKRIETHNIMIDWLRDNEGNEINLTFEI